MPRGGPPQVNSINKLNSGGASQHSISSLSCFLPVSHSEQVSGEIVQRQGRQKPAAQYVSTAPESRSVREICTHPHDRHDGTSQTSRPAHRSNHLIAQLNHRWRVVDDPSQWLLQCRKGNARHKASGWRNRSFCRSRHGLIRCIEEMCGEVQPDAFICVSTLPDIHSDHGGVK